MNLAAKVDGCGAPKRGDVAWLQIQYARVDGQRFVVIALFGEGLRQGELGEDLFRVALNGGLEGNERGIHLVQPVARHTEPEETFATRGFLVRLLKQAGRLRVVAGVESPLRPFQCLAPRHPHKHSRR